MYCVPSGQTAKTAITAAIAVDAVSFLSSHRPTPSFHVTFSLLIFSLTWPILIFSQFTIRVVLPSQQQLSYCSLMRSAVGSIRQRQVGKYEVFITYCTVYSTIAATERLTLIGSGVSSAARLFADLSSSSFFIVCSFEYIRCRLVLPTIAEFASQSVCRFLNLSITASLCNNGWTDRDPVFSEDSWGPKNIVLYRGPDPPRRKRENLGRISPIVDGEPPTTYLRNGWS